MGNRGIQIVQDHPDATFTWGYPESLVVNGDVIDEKKLCEAFLQFVKNNRKRPVQTVVTLTEEVVFYKKGILKTGLQEFLDLVPLEEAKMIKKIVEYKDGKVDVWVCNKSLVNAIVTALDGKLEGVVSEAMLKDGDYKNVWKDRNGLRNGSFLTKGNGTAGTSEKTWTWLVWGVGVMIWLGIIGALIYFKVLTK